MSTARYIVGDSLTVLRALPDASADLVLTSPPFLALRSYLPADHPDKALEMGSEPTPGAFIDALLDVVEECRRVLAPHGSIAVELGDTYAGSGGAGGDYNADGLREGQPKFSGSSRRTRAHNLAQGYSGGTHGHDTKEPGFGYTTGGDGWPLDKSLTLVPELFRFALAYGFNPLTGRTTPQWRVRNVVRWCRPNPPVGALANKFRPATSEMVVACVGRKRYFDLDAVRGERSPNTHARTARGVLEQPRSGKSADRDGNWGTLAEMSDTAGAPPLDWWEIPTHGYPGSHYATFPPALCVRPIKAMCPARVCRVCGVPSERVSDTQRCLDGEAVANAPALGDDKARRVQSGETTEHTTTGWTDCGCPCPVHDFESGFCVGPCDERWRPGLVLDPFAGSGTTGVVATGHGRDAVLIDLDSRNADLARERVGMWLTVEHHETKAVPA